MSVVSLRRVLVSVVVAVLAVGALAGCGSAEPEPASTPSGARSVTIEHKFGTTTVAGPVDRVVTIGFNEQDFAIALGVEPVGVREFLGYDAPARPWIPADLQGKAIPTVGSQDLDLEKIAGLAPDLILGINSYIDQPTYDKLAAIAPTVAQSDEYADGGTPWDVQTEQTGEALGKSSEAATLVTEVKAEFAEVKDAHPEFEGRTASFLLGLDAAGVTPLGTSDYRTGWLTELGFDVRAEGSEGNVSLEAIDTVDADVVMGENLPAKVTDTGVWKSLDAVKENRYIDFGSYDQDFAAAVGFNSPLSLSFVLEAAEPRLAAATDDDPATVPEPYTS